ncbi:hypothetical protein CMUS01_16118 [Colletotrichum musicola]|uniref:Uncharacterized protein n=1 Tax=Colletotrichum musicola TaxID=2175873 RepID=A0A8H6MJU6_9PEZI|nr:hypothetical protein CMUS01_16118 [Colletotrichum musicola]
MRAEHVAQRPSDLIPLRVETPLLSLGPAQRIGNPRPPLQHILHPPPEQLHLLLRDPGLPALETQDLLECIQNGLAALHLPKGMWREGPRARDIYSMYRSLPNVLQFLTMAY